ncbi:hypothetical protein [uncultured Kordia sp.]|nr:hypothetical protein [uncultured Kordia sp.]
MKSIENLQSVKHMQVLTVDNAAKVYGGSEVIPVGNTIVDDLNGLIR